ncbi:hypothetical protein [Anaerorhabdus sp.]|uniref:hypothetical protein n=1 Tax=Anaerorhabdus sp. TaxID=1872524 RepID=UPI002FCB55B6
MQDTTQTFYDNSIFKYRYTKYDLTFDVYDVTSKQDCTITSNSRRIEHLKELIDDINEPSKYFVEGEVSGFPLNGSKETMPDDLSDLNIGWWSPMSNENGTWDFNPVLTFDFTEAHTSIGITLNFDKFSKPNKIKISWFDERQSLILSKIDEVDSAECYIDLGMENYFKITIEFLETYPYRYIKLYEIWFGKKFLLTGDELTGCKIKEQISTISNQIYPNECKFDLDNTNGKYDVFNPTQLMKFFQKRQQVKTNAYVADRKTMNYESVPMGTYYLDKFETKSGKGNFVALGLINLMANQTFAKSKFYDNEKVSVIVSEVIPEYKYYIHDNVRDAHLTGYIPCTTVKDALKLIAVATGSIIKEGRDGIIYIYRPTEEVISNQIITENTVYEKYGFAGIQLAELQPMPFLDVPKPLIFEVTRETRLSELESAQIAFYDRCDVYCTNYIKDVNAEFKELFKGEVLTDENGIAIIQYSDAPVYELNVATTFTNLEFNHYAASTIVKGLPNTTYSLIVTGKIMIKNISIVTSTLGINSPGEIAQTIKLDNDNTLIGNVGTAKNLATWYLSQLQKRNDIKFNWWSVCTTEAGDFLNVDTSYGNKLLSQVTSIEYDMDGLTATVKGVV